MDLVRRRRWIDTAAQIVEHFAPFDHQLIKQKKYHMFWSLKAWTDFMHKALFNAAAARCSDSAKPPPGLPASLPINPTNK